MNLQERIRILAVDDHPLIREGVATVINDQPDMLIVAEATTGYEAIDKFRLHQPDIVLLDLRLPDMSGIEVLRAMRSENPNAKVIVLTTLDGDVEIHNALEAGARGYMLKSMPPPGLFDAIRQVHRGKMYIPGAVAERLAEHLTDEILSKREIEVLKQITAGTGNRAIGEKLFIAEETVKAHIRNIMQKLGATDRTQAVAIATRRGIIQL